MLTIRRGWWIIGAATFVFIMGAIFIAWRWNKWAETAAWVQAVGSLAIIAATAIIAGRQSREAKLKDAQAQRQLQESVASLTKACYGCFHKLYRASENNAISNTAFFPSEFEAIRHALSLIPSHQLGNQILIENILKMLGQTAYISAVLSQAPDFKIAFTKEGLKTQDTELWNTAAGIWRAVYGPARENEFRF